MLKIRSYVSFLLKIAIFWTSYHSQGILDIAWACLFISSLIGSIAYLVIPLISRIVHLILPLWYLTLILLYHFIRTLQISIVLIDYAFNPIWFLRRRYQRFLEKESGQASFIHVMLSKIVYWDLHLLSRDRTSPMLNMVSRSKNTGQHHFLLRSDIDYYPSIRAILMFIILEAICRLEDINNAWQPIMCKRKFYSSIDSALNLLPHLTHRTRLK